ncbi:glucokinase [Roseovarius sp. LXJ103]|uniref:glucokinase n=1 Tax=Roseovarius carneus TaxID=2853164 RepID=UPI000D61336F|nr:glucokinase [Roseovarius carneus]MBZ8118342.1 glucokinase [Roseovarius carneus]PWE35944.1 glucokinase [Pelagicola sp. LXJ1103]
MTTPSLLMDIGGTNTRLGLSHFGALDAASVETLRNADHTSSEALIETYLMGRPVSAIAAGVAGPVQSGTAQLTNIDWHVDGARLARITGAQTVHLINDLQAQGYALDDLAPESITEILPGMPVRGTRLVLGLGTGCNIAVVYRTGAWLFVPPSETGHSRLPHMPDLPDGVIEHLARSAPHLPIEAVLSGPALTQIAAWLGEGDDLPSLLQDPERHTTRIALHVLGHVIGDLALTHLPTEGITLIGGLARALAPHLMRPEFTERMWAKGPYRAIATRVPLRVLHDDTAALIGCARLLRQISA